MMTSTRPTVILAVKVRPPDSRYDLLDLAVNGALVEPIGPRTGDITVTVDPDLVGPNMNIHARVRGVNRVVAFGVYAWSSQLIDNAATPQLDERWVTLGQKSGADVLTVDAQFHPYPAAASAMASSSPDGGPGPGGIPEVNGSQGEA